MAAESIFDLQDTVSKIINVERAYLNKRIQDNKARAAEANDLSSIKSKLNTFVNTLDVLQDEDTFATKKATVSNSSYLTATPETGASDILFKISDVQLAQAATHTTASDSVFSGANYAGVKSSLESGNGSGLYEQINTGASFDPNVSVTSGGIFQDSSNMTAGSFVINDETIVVAEDDTLNEILTKINNSSANVTASYDYTNERVKIEHKEIGANNTISLGSDSTNFFEAVKIDEGTAVETEGTDHELYQNLNETSLSSIQSGFFTINNITISVDVDTHSLNDIITKINNSNAGVSVIYNEEDNNMTITSNNESDDIIIIDDTSDLLEELGLHTEAAQGDTTEYYNSDGSAEVNGTTYTLESNELTIHGTKINFLAPIDASTTETIEISTNKSKFLSAVKSMISAYNNAINTMDSVYDKNGSSSSFVYRLSYGIKSIFQKEVENDGSFSYLTDVGFSFERGISSGHLKLDEAKFNSWLDSDYDSVASLFSFDTGNNGLRTDGGITTTLEDYVEEYSKGTLGFLDQRKTTISKLVERVDISIQRQEDYFTLRGEQLLENLIKTQKLLQNLEQQYFKASSINVDLNLISGKRI